MSFFLALVLGSSADPGVSVQESRRAMAKLAECTVRLNHKQVSQELLSGHSSDQMRSAFIHMLDAKSCPADPKVAGAVIIMMLNETAHFSMSEAMVARSLKAPIQSLANAPQIATATFDPAVYEPRANRKYTNEQIRNLQKNADRARYISELTEMGDCVVRTDTGNSQRLLLSPIDSDQENFTLAALKSAIGKCLPSGQSFRLDKALLRGAIGFNFYRLANAAGVRGGVN